MWIHVEFLSNSEIFIRIYDLMNSFSKMAIEKIHYHVERVSQILYRDIHGIDYPIILFPNLFRISTLT